MCLPYKKTYQVLKIYVIFYGYIGIYIYTYPQPTCLDNQDLNSPNIDWENNSIQGSSLCDTVINFLQEVVFSYVSS